jgi:hypothetical protein
MKIKIKADTACENSKGELVTVKKGETLDAADAAGAYLVEIGKAEAIQEPDKSKK